MLAIRLQRLGRTGYPTYRLAVQESHRHPSSGRVVAYVGSHNPHTKETTLNLEKVEFYLKNGAQPTPRVVKVLESQKIKLPDWVKRHAGDKKAAIKKADKLRKHQPKDEPKDEPAETVAEETAAETPDTESAEDEAAEAPEEAKE